MDPAFSASYYPRKCFRVRPPRTGARHPSGFHRVRSSPFPPDRGEAARVFTPNRIKKKKHRARRKPHGPPAKAGPTRARRVPITNRSSRCPDGPGITTRSPRERVFKTRPFQRQRTPAAALGRAETGRRLRSNRTGYSTRIGRSSPRFCAIEIRLGSKRER